MPPSLKNPRLRPKVLRDQAQRLIEAVSVFHLAQSSMVSQSLARPKPASPSTSASAGARAPAGQRKRQQAQARAQSGQGA